MAITKVQQTQISGSLSFDDTLEAGAGLAGKANLKGDLDALRSQIKQIVGKSNWYSALDGSQDLADIYAAVRVSGADSALQGTLSVSGTSTQAAINASGNFAIATDKFTVASGSGNTAIAGTLGVAQLAQFAAINASGAVALSSTLSAGASTLGSLGVTGAATVGTTLGVTGASSFSTVGASGAVVLASTLQAGASSLSSLTVSGASSFSTVGASGAVVLASTLQAGASSLSSLTVSGASSLAAVGASGAAMFASTLGVLGASQFANVSNSFNALAVSGSNGLAVAGPSSLVGAVGITGILSANSPSNVMNGLSITGSNGLSISSNLLVAGNATVNGDLYVKGATTYIQTDNMIVKDAFIYLATGSAGSSDSGLVLSRGAGASWDLIMGQRVGAGEIVFAKQAVQTSFDSPAVIAASALVPAWMSVAKIGANEGTMVGSLSKSGNDFLVAAVDAGAQLQLQSAGNAAISFASAAQVPDASFAASTIIGMLNELRTDVDAGSAGGNLSKVSYAGNSAAISAGVLTFISQTLASANHKLVDVFLNGVMLSPVYDLTAITTTSVTLAAGIASSLMADDVIVVVARG